MTGFTERNGTLFADHVPLTEIAAQSGTPAYVYSASRMRQNLENLETAFRDVLPPGSQPFIAYACKHNTSMAVLKLFAGQGIGLDTVSEGEIEKGLAAGVPGQHMVFSGVGKGDSALLLAIRNNVLILAESQPEVERIGVLAEQNGLKARLGLRFNPDVAADTHAKITTGKKENKFGLPAEDIEAIYRRACDHPYIQAEGISVHIGSQIMELAPFRAAFERLADLVRHLRSAGLEVSVTDLGGGLGVPYHEDQNPVDLHAYAEIIRDTILPLNTKIIVEPGRLLVGNAGVLLSKVLYIKETKTKRFMILDAGMSELIRPALYDAYHPVRPVIVRNGEPVTYDVVGPICESADVFGVDRTMSPVQQGDLVAIMVCGAMGMPLASNYNTRPFCPEILVDGDKCATVRQRQSVQDIMKYESVPDWLDA